jgi:hypothetical protein
MILEQLCSFYHFHDFKSDKKSMTNQLNESKKHNLPLPSRTSPPVCSVQPFAVKKDTNHDCCIACGMVRTHLPVWPAMIYLENLLSVLVEDHLALHVSFIWPLSNELSSEFRPEATEPNCLICSVCSILMIVLA